MYLLPEGEFTLVIEFFPALMDQVTVSVVSTSLNIGRQSTKLFSKYRRSIIHLHKYDVTPPEYIFVDLRCQGIANSPFQGRGHLVIYGIEGKQSDVSSDVFDELYYLENKKTNMIVPIDMNNKKITNVEVGDDDGDVDNFQQLNSYVNAAKILLNNKIYELTTKVNAVERQIVRVLNSHTYYYKQIFEFYASTLDPDEFKNIWFQYNRFQ